MQMSVDLSINDGSPIWWLSPDIGILSPDCNGDDVSTMANTVPKFGTTETVFFKATVHNNGTTQANNVEVQFWVCNPPGVGFGPTSTGVTSVGKRPLLTNTPLLGSTTRKSECVPYFDSVAGHRCVIAQALHDEDKGGFDPNAPFDPLNLARQAQRNFEVIRSSPLKGMRGRFEMEFFAHNTAEKPLDFDLEVRVGELKDIAALLQPFNLEKTYGLPAKLGKPSALGLLTQKSLDATDLKDARLTVAVNIPAGGRKRLNLVGRLGTSPALIHVIQMHKQVVIGGLSVLVVKS
jgi:uncharacterized repeat protein (TIGR01451 family)